jgi:hypothetical protein
MKTGCGIELISETIIMLREVIEERYIATPPANSANEPAIETPSTPFAANLRSARLRADRLFRSRSSAWVKSNRAAVADEGHRHRLYVSSTVKDLLDLRPAILF